ncbi:endonuclease V [Geitlerinema sp. PCC 9228]|jgi:deoxyribonuclease V|uniref:endonuclease V n=1 Tax=Geitlerinema sp. PCC 9228 TaxID=111611 RepID=UPI0008F9AB3D|nr:endonuclease V [Geitlerinema sp. PCC 9228]
MDTHLVANFPVPENLETAQRLQTELAQKLILAGDTEHITHIAALDASIKQGEDLVAAAVLWDMERQEAVEVGIARIPGDEVFPYVPGFLSFREAPVYLAALAELSPRWQLLLVDGQGIAHPRSLGIAAHLGVYLDMPAIGVAKSWLYGKARGELDDKKGAAVSLFGEVCGQKQQVGWRFRSRTHVKPVYVSPGHRLDCVGALAFVRQVLGKTKLPEPLRKAHYWAGRARKEQLKGCFTLVE